MFYLEAHMRDVAQNGMTHGIVGRRRCNNKTKSSSSSRIWRSVREGVKGRGRDLSWEESIQFNSGGQRVQTERVYYEIVPAEHGGG